MRLNGKRVRVYETGISYAGRTYEEGKKINWKDAVSAIIQIIRWTRYRPSSRSSVSDLWIRCYEGLAVF
jgi:hypothetical protein